MESSVIEITRQLGKAIQADSRYECYVKTKVANDSDTELQGLIDEFNRGRAKLNREVSRTDGKDENLIAELKASVGEQYSVIMSNEHMKAYNDAKNEMDLLLRQVTQIIAMSANGENPETCDPTAAGCTGSCSTCGGCH